MLTWRVQRERRLIANMKPQILVRKIVTMVQSARFGLLQRASDTFHYVPSLSRSSLCDFMLLSRYFNIQLNEKQIAANQSKRMHVSSISVRWPFYFKSALAFFISGKISHFDGGQIEQHTHNSGIGSSPKASGKCTFKTKAILGRSHSFCQFPRTKSIRDEQLVFTQLETLCLVSSGSRKQ